MYAMIFGKTKPTVCRDFHEAKEKAVVGDRILLVNRDETEEYIVPDYAKMHELETRIKTLGKFSSQRRALTLELQKIMVSTLKFEERSKKNG